MAVDMESEGLIDEKEAVSRPEADGIAAFLSPIFDSKAKEEAVKNGKVLAKGLPAGPGGASARSSSTQSTPNPGRLRANGSSL